MPKSLLLALLLVAPSAPAHAAPPDTTLAVMSFNLRLDVASDGADAWPQRRAGVARLIGRHAPDVVGVQEAQRHMLAELYERLPAYRWVGTGREPGAPRTEYSALLYRPDRLALLAHDTFWLSETPERPASRGWDAALPRIVTWARFRDRATGTEFVAANTHFDHVGHEARAQSARLLRRRLHALAGGAPVVLTGDFNAAPDSEPYRLLTDPAADGPALVDAFHTAAEGHVGPASTWTGFDALVPGRRIDYVFTAGPVDVLRHRIVDERLPSGRWPSDHLPVLAHVRWR